MLAIDPYVNRYVYTIAFRIYNYPFFSNVYADILFSISSTHTQMVSLNGFGLLTDIMIDLGSLAKYILRRMPMDPSSTLLSKMPVYMVLHHWIKDQDMADVPYKTAQWFPSMIPRSTRQRF